MATKKCRAIATEINGILRNGDNVELATLAEGSTQPALALGITQGRSSSVVTTYWTALRGLVEFDGHSRCGRG